MIEAADFIEFNLGGSYIKMTPTGVVINATKVDLKGSALVVIKGAMTKINSGGAAGGCLSTPDNIAKTATRESTSHGIQQSPEPTTADGFGAKDAASLGLDATPVVGTLKGVGQVITGEDLVTGESVHRGMEALGAAASIIPGGKALFKLGTKGAGGKKGKANVDQDRGVRDNGAKNVPPPKRKEIELEPGQKGNWNKDLNKKLRPNTDYKVGNKTYKTDELGRVKQVKGELTDLKHDRNKHQQSKSGKETGIKDGLKKDDGGHLISSRHDGVGEQINYVPMNSNLNRGSWKKMENEWDDALKNGKKVEIDIRPIYEGSSKRPTSFKVFYEIDGVEKFKSFNNVAGE